MNMFYEDRFLTTVGVVGLMTVTGIACYKIGKFTGIVTACREIVNGLDEDLTARRKRSFAKDGRHIRYTPYYTD